jgi:hypothetical protein
VATNREVTYVEEKGLTCDRQAHRRNHTLAATRLSTTTFAARAS